MRIMQPGVHEVIDLVAVWYRLVSAVRAVIVRAADLRRAVHGFVAFNNMFVDVIFVRMVQMTLVKVIYMAVMPNCRMAAARAMLMGMVGMVLLNANGHFPPRRAGRNLPPA
jgi:hypothetical protein